MSEPITVASSPRSVDDPRDEEFKLYHHPDGSLQIVVLPSWQVSRKDRETYIQLSLEALEQHLAAGRAEREAQKQIKIQQLYDTLVYSMAVLDALPSLHEGGLYEVYRRVQRVLIETADLIPPTKDTP